MDKSTSRRSLLAAGLAAPMMAAAATPAEAAGRPISFHVWDGLRGWQRGTRQGLGITRSGTIRIWDDGVTRWTYLDPHRRPVTFDQGIWTSEWTPVGFGLSELITSWNASTPAGTAVEIAARFQTGSGRQCGWFIMARWTASETSQDIVRTSVPNQSNGFGRVSTDVFVAAGSMRYPRIQLRVKLLRRAGLRGSPSMSLVAATASALPSSTSTVPVSTPGQGRGIVLPVPAYSQERHRGHYPQWNGGGEAWCSPTCTAMVVDYWQAGLSAAETAWVTLPGETRPQVDATARGTYDASYRGTGNWTFNTAWAGTRGLRSYVTRLRSLAEAEKFIAARVPLICSVSFKSSELPGAGYSTQGHLLTIVGFDSSGNVVCNDPASHMQPDDAQVRVTYPRAQFENVWIAHSGGTAYVIAPRGTTLPIPPAQPNWG